MTTRRFRWISGGVTIGVVASTLTAGSLAHADNQGPLATASVVWSSADSTFQWWAPGTPRDYTTGISGWKAGPVTQIGTIGFERPTQANPTRRQDYFAWQETLSQVQGVRHRHSSWAEVVSDSLVSNRIDLVVTAEGNSLRWEAGIKEAKPGSLPLVRFFHFTELPATFSPLYEHIDTQTLLITDQSGTHAALVLHAQSSEGEILFRGRQNIDTILTSSNRLPTVYVRGFSGVPASVSITATIIDYDPCAAEQLATTARALDPDDFGEVIPTLSGCVATSEWELTLGSDAPTPLPITLDARAGELGAQQSRVFQVDGLPEGMTVEQGEVDGQPVLFAEVTEAVAPGDYSVFLEGYVEDTSVTPATLSQPLRQPLALRVNPEPPPPPPPAPETEPEPEAELEPENPVSEESAVSPVAESLELDLRRNGEKRPSTSEVVEMSLVPTPLVRSEPSPTEKEGEPEEGEERPRFEFQELEPPQEITPTPPPTTADTNETASGPRWWGVWWGVAALVLASVIWWVLLWRRRHRQEETRWPFSVGD